MSNKEKSGTSNQEKQEWYTPAEAGKYLRVSRQTIYAYMDDGLLEYFVLKTGRGRRIHKSALDALLIPPDDT